MVYKVVLIRHGESQWNKENRFTGWTDVPLSETGVSEAIAAGQSLKADNYSFDVVYTSKLKRAIHTTWNVLKELDQSHIPVINNWRLNERHYGALQGLNKSETAAKHGEEQVLIWRRAYDVAPPALEENDERHPANQSVYKDLPPTVLPATECLKDTVDRVIPYWYDQIAPSILSGKNVLVSAHGNSLRALLKHLENMSESEVLALNIPTAVPLVVELDEKLHFIKKYYLLDEEELKRKLEAVANQGKAAKH